MRDAPDDFWADNDRTGRVQRTAGGPGRGSRGDAPRGGGGGGRRGGGGGGHSDGGPPRSRGERFKQWLLYGSWWRHWTWKKALGVVGAGIGAFVLLAIIGVAVAYSMTPIPTDVSQWATAQSSSVYYSNGKPLGTFTGPQDINRQLLTTGQIPQNVDQAIIAAEDRNFYHEGGISITGIARAGYEDLFGSGGLQGGSTLTEQYAKNYYANIGASRSATTKIKEIFVSIKLAHEKSKPWILTNYLNTVPFGPNVYGVWAASETYFSKNLAKSGTTLTTAQAAMLGAMPNQPSLFNPNPSAGAGYQLLVQRWQYVLTNMARDGAITQQQANALCASCALPAAEKVFNKSIQLKESASGNGWTGYAGYLMSMVEQQMEAPAADGGFGLTSEQLDTGGYRITTTFNAAKIQALAHSVNQEKAAIRAVPGYTFHNYDRIGSVLENPKTGAIVAIYGGDGYYSKHCKATQCDLNNAEAAEPVGSSFKPYVLATAVNEGMNVFTSKLNGYSPIWIPTNGPNSTAVQMTLSSLTAPAGISATSPYGGTSTNGMYYFKFDETDEDSGKPLPVNIAAAISSDPAFEDLAHRDGIDAVIKMAGELGVGRTPFVSGCQNSPADATDAQIIKDCNDLTGGAPTSKIIGQGLVGNYSTDHYTKAAYNNGAGTPGSPTIALGGNPLTPVEQASTFATFADDGVYHAPHVVQALAKGTRNVPVVVATRQVLTASQAADVDWALSFDNNYPLGTAEGSVPFRRGDVIGKTGTLGSGATASEAWFVGATPDQYSMSVALFTNDPGQQTLDNLPYANGTQGSQGGAWPATTWNNFMTTEFSNVTPVPLFPTDDAAPFQTWIQVLAQVKPTCQAGQYRNCTCPQGQTCVRPNPNPSGAPSPSTTPTCGTVPAGQPCTSGAPTNPTPTPSSSCSHGYGQPPCFGGNAETASSTRSTTAVAVTAALVPPAEEATVTVASLLRYS